MARLTYYKCVRPDGRDFHTGTIDYAAALASGETIKHPAAEMVRDDPATHLSVSIHATNCTGMRWPCRLFRVEPVGPVLVNASKRACHALRVIEELPAHMALGPQGEQVAALIERAGRLTADEIERLAASRAASWAASRAASRAASLAASWAASRAAIALLARDLISTEHYDTLIAPWRDVIGEVE